MSAAGARGRGTAAGTVEYTRNMFNNPTMVVGRGRVDLSRDVVMAHIRRFIRELRGADERNRRG
jgi:hypothetical protein